MKNLKFIFLTGLVIFMACPPASSPPTFEEKSPANKVTVDGKEYSLTYVDEFKNYKKFLEDWDIGNPGYFKPEVGNLGHDKPDEVKFDDGFLGYKNDRYKQPYWSPKATIVKNGFLEIYALFDPTVPVYDKDGKYVKQGYAISGAVHSRRQFPYGYFEARLIFDRNSQTHWDAFWFESNNPFSRQYGKKKLFTPLHGMLPTGVDAGVITQQKTTKYTENNRAPAVAKGFNGQQIYEYDLFEWVNSKTYGPEVQWNVLHSWDWYGGYTGTEHFKDIANGGDQVLLKDAFGDACDMKTIDGFRKEDARGGTLRFANDKPQKKEYFTLGMLWTKEKIVMYFDGEKKLEYLYQTGKKHFDNDKLDCFIADDRFNPIQVKFSTEIGSWDNDHAMFEKVFANDGTKIIPKPDVMCIDYFAFYAAEPDETKWYGGRTDFAID